MTVEQAIEFLPNAPAYEAGGDGWSALDDMRSMVRLSVSGMQKMRGRFKHSYERRDAQGRIWIYTPYWLRVWKVEQQLNEQK